MRKLICFGMALLLCACSTIKSANEVTEEQQVHMAQINIQLGMAYLAKQDMQRAKQKLLQAVDKSPTLPEAWYTLGYFYEASGEKAWAATAYRKAVTLAPSRGDTHNNYGTYLCRVGDYKNAISEFNLATRDSNYLHAGSAYENAGLCAMKIPDKAIAKHYFKLALAKDPSLTKSLQELKRLH